MRLSCGILLLLVMMGGGQQEEQEEQQEQGELEDKEEQMKQQLVCSSIRDCAACISAPGCVYCRDPEYTSEERSHLMKAHDIFQHLLEFHGISFYLFTYNYIS